MIGFRPTPSTHYLSRPRLLARLPDTPGHVVLLEAPYGYGKTVLASQWADALEGQGWRVAWLALAAQSEPRAALAERLELPSGAPWGVVLDALWSVETVLVIEDADAADALTPLLARVEGLLLIAGRERFIHPALPLLRTEGRLTRLGATDLSFREEEAAGLFDDPAQAKRLFDRTRGWPLPLHFAALTGEEPEREALVEGIRASLSAEAWQEALLLTAIPQLPVEAAIDATREVVSAGFAQQLERAIRLHPLTVESLVAQYETEIRDAVSKGAARLPPLVRGAAYESVGLGSALAQLLEEVDADLDRRDPAAVVRWDALAPGSSERRDLVAGSALGMTGQSEEAVRRLERAAQSTALEPDLRLRALGDAMWFSAIEEPQRARAYAARGEALLDAVAPERAGRFLNNVSYLDFVTGDFQAARDSVVRALEAYPVDSPLRFGPLTNLAVLDWNLHGDLDQRMQRQRETLEEARRRQPDAVASGCRDLARSHVHLGEIEQAVAYCRESQASARPDPLAALEAAAMEAFLLGEPSRFARLLTAARRWDHAYTTDVVGFYWLRCLRVHGETGPAGRATRHEAMGALENAGGGPLVQLEVALLRAERGDATGALQALEPLETAYPERDYRLYWAATRYLISRETADLDALLGLTLVGPRVLPGLVPLEALPRDRPELARTYPLDDVLTSGWTEAVQLRVPELPPLQVRLFGAIETRVRGARVELTRRQREIVALSLLGESRDAIGAALWPELDQAKVRNNLGVQWTLLRRALEPWGAHTYVAEHGLVHVRSDVDALREALARGDAATASRIYRQPLAPGVDLPVVAEARTVLQRDVVVALMKAATAPVGADRDGDDNVAVAHLERVLELEPLHEQALQQLLQRLARLGRRREARARFERFARLLREETGLQPLPETLRAAGAEHQG